MTPSAAARADGRRLGRGEHLHRGEDGFPRAIRDGEPWPLSPADDHALLRTVLDLEASSVP